MSDFLGIVYTNDSDQAFSNSGAKTAMITPKSEVGICREVFNVSEFHFSEVYFF